MSTSLSRPKLATLDELLAHEFYKRLVASTETTFPEMRKIKSPNDLIKSKFSRDIVEVYKTLFSGSFNKLDMASLEHSDYLSHLLPCLSLDSFPLIANLDYKSQKLFKKVKLCFVMTCVWCFVENHSSGRSEYVDVLSNVSSSHKDSFECLFLNAAQLLMLESWNEDLCDYRDFDSFERLTVLEQRALLRFFIVCFQRIELTEVRRCCMSLLSPQVWMHIPEELREANFFKNNKVSKLLFMKSYENYKLKHKSCNFNFLLSDANNSTNKENNSTNSSSRDNEREEYDSVKRLYKLEPNSKNLEYLNLSYRLVLTRDFMNSVMNQFIYILEDYLSYFNNSTNKENNTSNINKDNQTNTNKENKEREEEDYDLMRLMYVENYLELFVDLLSQLHLRRIVKPLIEYKLILVRCKNHLLYESVDSNYGRNKTKYDTNIFVELVNILEYYLNFNINEELGVSVEYNVILEEYYKRFNKFQRVCYLNYKNDENLKNIHLVNNYSLNTNLVNILSNLNLNVLIQLNQKLFLIPSGNNTNKDNSSNKDSDSTNKENQTNTNKENKNNRDKERDEKEERDEEERDEDYLWPRSVELLPKKKKSKKLVKKLLISNLTNYLKKPTNELVFINKNNFYLNPFSSLFSSSSTLNPELLENSRDNQTNTNKEKNSRDEEFGRDNRYSEFDGGRREDEFVEFEEEMGYIKLGTLSLFKLNLQYLTLFDYLYRNFILYQFEVIFQIKQYIQQQIYLLFSFSSKSFSSLHGRNINSRDGGFSRDNNTSNNTRDNQTNSNNENNSGYENNRSNVLATTSSFSKGAVDYEAKQLVEKPNWVGRMFISVSDIVMKVGSKKVEMTVAVDLSLIQDYKIRQEWQQLTKYDILYLIQLLPHYSRFSTGNKDDDELLWGKDVRRIRFGEILEVLDEEDNNVLEFNPLDKKSFAGFVMRVKLLLDYEQYMKDIQEDLEYYSSFNLVMRRSKRQNNFKSILTNIQSVLNHKVVIPNWLQVLLLGYIHSLKTDNKNKNKDNKEEIKENKRRKINEKEETKEKVGINYLNTFKSKEQFLRTTRFVSVKLVPFEVFVDNNNNKENNEERDEKENRMYVDVLDNDFNEYVYSSNRENKNNKEELVSKLKVMMLNNDKVALFIENYLRNNLSGENNSSNSRDGEFSRDNNSSNNRENSTNKENKKEKGKNNNKEKKDNMKPLGYLELYGVKFEVYVEESYLGGLNKVNNNYYVGNNQTPRFLITNFNEPYDVKRSFGVSSSGSGELIKTMMGSSSISSDFKFVGRQVESIVNGSLEGLTVIMGPPGTGKTDVVSQIIAILFNNFENEKIVICTHSNFALNDIFTKLVRNEMIDEHYMVRLGHSDLEVDQMGHFSKFGRVNYILQRRLDLLEVIKNLKEQVNVLGDYEFTIQYSLAFLQYYLLNNEELFENNNKENNNSNSRDNETKTNKEKRVENNERDEDVEMSDVNLMERGLDNFFRLGLEFPYTLKDVKKLYYKVHDALKSRENNSSNSRDNEDNKNKEVELKNMKRRFVEKLYECLNELLPFEVLRNNRDRMKYLVENYCRIVAMTCTHASIAREELSTLNYKSLIFEEAAQVLEIESFIPICSDIKRLVLVGDHLQLSPIIQNSSLQKYSNLNQSLFLRLIRLKYPYVQLNVQARSKQEILNVYKDFYPHEIYTLDDTDERYEEEDDRYRDRRGREDQREETKENKEREEKNRTKTEKETEKRRDKENKEREEKNKLVNMEEFRERVVKGFKVDLRYSVQFLDVRGEESSPIKYFYQNLDEAHYCVHLYMVMRLMGLEDIVILTAYNGQKCLIEDIVKKKCSWNNRIGTPMVSTIDKFQGRQANYVIVSLVRTKNVGYLRDPRRFVVATSRSKLGLYVVGSKKLIQNVKELSVFNKQLNKYPNKLYLKLNPNQENEENNSSDSRDNQTNTNKKNEEKLFEVKDEKELELLVQMLM